MAAVPRRHSSRSPFRGGPNDEGSSRLGSHWRRDGQPKASYMSQGEALSVAEERTLETGLRLDVYRCPVCSAWHMGSPVETES